MEENQEIPKYSIKLMWEFIFVTELICFIVIPAFCLRYLSLSVFTALSLFSVVVTLIAWVRLIRQIRHSFKRSGRFPKRPHRRSAIIAIFAGLAGGDLILGHAIEYLLGDLRSNFGNVVPVVLGFGVTFLMWKMYPTVLKIYAARKRLRERRLRSARAAKENVGYETP